jgi:hypothetical protein
MVAGEMNFAPTMMVEAYEDEALVGRKKKGVSRMAHPLGMEMFGLLPDYDLV